MDAAATCYALAVVRLLRIVFVYGIHRTLRSACSTCIAQFLFGNGMQGNGGRSPVGAVAFDFRQVQCRCFSKASRGKSLNVSHVLVIRPACCHLWEDTMLGYESSGCHNIKATCHGNVAKLKERVIVIPVSIHYHNNTSGTVPGNRGKSPGCNLRDAPCINRHANNHTIIVGERNFPASMRYIDGGKILWRIGGYLFCYLSCRVRCAEINGCGHVLYINCINAANLLFYFENLAKFTERLKMNIL